MNNLAELDKNFKVEAVTLNKDDIKFYNPLNAPFKVCGMFYENGYFRRMPEKVAETVSPGVASLHKCTPGGKIRFKTDSKYVAFSAKLPYFTNSVGQALVATSGFDLYIHEDGQDKFNSVFYPPNDIENGYEGMYEFEDKKMREIIINFPIYAHVSEFFIGLSSDAVVLEPTPYTIEKPIVFYGSSITQGGCASRAGNAYPNMVGRKFDANVLNLGFSGNGRAEKEMAEYISGLDMSIFVYDYDHNAPDSEHLEKTHEPMFKIIREKNPNLPIIMLTSTSYERYLGDRERRKSIICNTYKNALDNGDKNVYYIDGSKIFEECGDDAQLEGCHPNDIGFYFIAKAVSDVIKEIIK